MAGAADPEIIITEVTRMTGDKVCVAGIDLATGRMVRPLQPGGQNWEEGKWIGEGWFGIGKVVRLETAEQSSNAPPHGREDFRVARVTSVRQASAAELYHLCAQTADPTLEAIVGGSLIDGKFIEEGTDCRSLGCLMMDGGDLRFSGKYDKVQVSWLGAFGVWHNLKLKDLAASKLADTEAEAARLRAATDFAEGPLALRIGLARPWDGGDLKFDPRRCTLQLNGLVFPA